jgi:hypothetical protein
MPLFNFTANTYGENWFVSCQTKEEAISAVRRAIHANWQREMAYAKEETKRYGKPSDRAERETENRDDQMMFLEACINNKPTYAGGTPCSIEELEDGRVHRCIITFSYG